MSQETSGRASKKTVRDPVDRATLDRLTDLHANRAQIAEQMLDIEQEKVRLMIVVRRLDDERNQIFARVLTERGLAPNTPIDLDPRTGQIELLRPEPPQPEVAVDPTPEPQPVTPEPTPADSAEPSAP